MDLVDGGVPLGPAVDPEALVEESLVHPLDKAVGAGCSDPGGSVLDLFELEEELEEERVLAAAEFAAVVGEQRLDGHAQSFIEGQNQIMEQVAGRDQHLGGVDRRRP